ncbi:MAG: helix-turn-helix domain-containing protein [Pseudomonadota bacterium]
MKRTLGGETGNGGMQEIDTQNVGASERLDFWRDAVGALFPKAEIDRAAEGEFRGAVRWRNVAEIAISDISSVAQRVRRSEDLIRADGPAYFELNYQLEGEGVVSQGGREAKTRPGEYALYDSTRPFEMRFDGPFRQLSLKIPRRLLVEKCWSAEQFTAQALPGRAGVARALFALVDELRGDPAPLDAAVGERMQDHITDLLTTSLATAPAKKATAKSPAKAAALGRLKSVILSELSDPDLTPARAAASAGLSLRSAYLLFEAEGCSIAAWIMDRRLDRCRRDLTDSFLANRSISEIAYSWGFSDPAHLSRRFRTRFGCAPRDLRSARTV